MDYIFIPILVFSVLILTAILTSPISTKSGVPLLPLFIIIGIVASTGTLNPLFNFLYNPKTVFFITAPALALILFDCGLHTPLKLYLKSIIPASLLASLGVLINMLLMYPFNYYILELENQTSFLFASILASTDAAAVFLLLKSKKLYLKKKVKSLLELESGANDPMAIFLTLTGLFIFSNPSKTLQKLPQIFLDQFLLGFLGSIILFFIMLKLLKKIKLEKPLYPLFIITLALIGFAGISIIGGSGYLALYLTGLFLGSQQFQEKENISKFWQSLSWLSQILMFTSLGIFVLPNELKHVIWPALATTFFLTFIARPIMIFLLLFPFKKYTLKEKCFLSFVGLRGATSVLLALFILIFNVPKKEYIFNLTFLTVLISLSFQGLLLPFIAKKLNVARTKKLK